MANQRHDSATENCLGYPYFKKNYKIKEIYLG